MQTTLLGLAIALILALVTALVGPYFVNWSDHRAFFEAEASRLVGLNVQVTGPIAVGVLPFPSVTLSGIAIGPAGEPSRLRARSLGIHLSLGSLMRGEVRAEDIRLVGPEFSLGVNSLGHIDWPAMTLATDTLSIDRLNVEDGRAVLTDATSGSRLVLDRLWFNGEVRSLSGPVRGEGAFVTAGNLYGYKLSIGRYGDEGLRLRLSVDASERPLSIEAEGMLTFDGRQPRLDGSFSVARPAGAVLATGQAVANEPWRVAGKLKANSASALLEQLEFQYGPEERAVKLTGAADLKFGERPRLQGALSARQVDLDRLIATPDVPRRLPLAAIQSFAELLGGSVRPQLPVSLTVSVDAVTLGGATLQGVGTDLRTAGDGWHLDKLEFRAPGFTQVNLSGRLDMARAPGASNAVPAGLRFAGAASVDANDPKSLVAWLAGRTGTAAQIKPWNVRGEVTLGADRIAIERLKTEFERGTIEGRLAYTWPAGDRPARLDANLKADELDIDAILGFGDAALSGLGLEWPREVALALEADRARIAGFEARKSTARVTFDARGVAIERLAIADFGNATIEASGRIETTSSPGGNITVDLDARELNGIIALAERFAPPLAAPLRHLAGTQKTAKLRATVSLQPASGSATAKLDLAGRIGAVRVNLAAAATGQPEAFAVTDLRALSATDLRLDAQLEADHGGILLALIGLDRMPAADRQPARLRLSAAGPLSRELRVEGKLVAGVIDADGKGTLRLPDGKPATLELDQLAGSIGGSKAQGKLLLTFAETARIDGAVETESLDVPAVIASMIGVQRSKAGDAATWSSEPFVPSASELGGRIAFKAQRAALSSAFVAHQLRGVFRFGTSQIVFEDVDAELVGGRLAGRLAFVGSPDGVSARGRLGLTGGDAAAVVSGPGRAPVTGRLGIAVEFEGAGLSPAAFVGSLAGAGTVTLDGAQLAGLNPRVFDAVIRAVELGIPTDVNRIRDFVTTSLDNGNLPLTSATGALTISAGQLRLTNVATRVSGADLAVSASVGLADATLDATLTLTGTPVTGMSIRPMVSIALKGPLMAPRRTVDAAVLASWLALRAVEQQTKRLDAMEQAQRDAIAAQPPAVSAPVSAPTAVQAPPLPPPVTVLPTPRPAAPRAAPRAETSGTPPEARPRVQQNPTVRTGQPQPGQPLDLLRSQN